MEDSPAHNAEHPYASRQYLQAAILSAPAGFLRSLSSFVKQYESSTLSYEQFHLNLKATRMRWLALAGNYCSSNSISGYFIEFVEGWHYCQRNYLFAIA